MLKSTSSQFLYLILSDSITFSIYFFCNLIPYSPNSQHHRISSSSILASSTPSLSGTRCCTCTSTHFTTTRAQLLSDHQMDACGVLWGIVYAGTLFFLVPALVVFCRYCTYFIDTLMRSACATLSSHRLFSFLSFSSLLSSSLHFCFISSLLLLSRF